MTDTRIKRNREQPKRAGQLALAATGYVYSALPSLRLFVGNYWVVPSDEAD